MTDDEIRRIAEETGTPEAVIRTALPLIPVDKHSEWIGLLKSDNPASKMAHSYGWTVQHAISYLTDTPPIRKRPRFRLTIRDLIWLIALLVSCSAIWAAWQWEVSGLQVKLNRLKAYAQYLEEELAKSKP